MDVDQDSTTGGSFVQRWGSPAKPPPAHLPVSLITSVVSEKIDDLNADLLKLPHRTLVPPDTLEGASSPPTSPADVPMTDPEKVALAKKLKQTDALLEHEKTNRINAEQILQAHIGDQVAEVAPSHQLPADAPQDAICEACVPPKGQNPLENINTESKLVVQALNDGISLQDFNYDKYCNCIRDIVGLSGATTMQGL